MNRTKVIRELSAVKLTLQDLRDFVKSAESLPDSSEIKVQTFEGQRDARTDGVRVILKIEEVRP